MFLSDGIFKSAICTERGVVGHTDSQNPRLASMTTIKVNMEMVINARVDQIGSETETILVVELVKEGRVTEERVNQAVKTASNEIPASILS